MTDPVTVSIARVVDPAYEELMMAWLRAGQGLVVVARHVARS